MNSVTAQDLHNNGLITNTGTIRVKDQALGLPPAVDGVFEFFGASQAVPARQYRDLVLSGSGTKSTVGGSFSVSGNISVNPGVLMDVEAGQTITLIGNLVEQGYLRGSIGKTVNLSGGTTSSNFGDIGATIAWSGIAPGQTTVTRVSGTAVIGNGNQSILRYYDIATTFGSSLNGTLTFRYNPSELNGKDPNALELWRSPDGGVTWRRQTGTNLPAFNSIVKSGVVSFSRWTASDTSNLLGPAAYEWIASALASASGDGQSAPAGTVLSPFVVTVTDFFGNPIAGTTVTFLVDSIPSGASGYSLSNSIGVTNSSGQASTVLTLGNTAGIYRVRASSGSLSGSPRTFIATATSAVNDMVEASGNNQVDTINAILAPFAVEVRDGGGSSVAGVVVNFAITSKPAGETGSALSTVSATSDGLGRAATVLRLGNKAGVYEVTATTVSLPGAQVRFNATAIPGAAALLVAQGGSTTQQDTILQTLDSLFAVRILDAGANNVPNVLVNFAISNAPASAAGHSLSATSVLTDAGGIASTRLTLGSKIGIYEITAVASTLPNSPFVFTAQAMRGAPTQLSEAGGNGQQKTVATTLDTAFVVRLTDIGGNAIPGAPVQFAIASKPAGTNGDGLSALLDTTNAAGEATATLTLGTRSGVYRVIAVSSVLPNDTTTFTAIASAGAPAAVASVSGDGQAQIANTTLGLPFVVSVVDAYGNPISGANVQFALVSTPTGATGYQLNPPAAMTDALGRAQSVLRLGNMPGQYVTEARVSGVPAAQFTATATFILADVNSDFDVNIADLTSIIDHILQRRILTGIDSARADANRDGAINVLDIVLIQNSLLGTQPLPKTAGEVPATLAEVGAIAPAVQMTGELEITPLGLRFNLSNDVPVKGLQLTVRLNVPGSVDRPDVVFPRAQNMQFFVNTQASEIKVLAYNLQNTPVEQGVGSVVRLPVVLNDTTQIDSVYAIVSTADTSFDVAVSVAVTKKIGVYPTTFRLYQNYPNPFNNETRIVFEIPDLQGKFAKTLVQVFNLLGEKVKTLSKGEHPGGRYTVIWDGTDLSGARVPSGVYFYRIVSGDYVSAKRMVLIK